MTQQLNFAYYNWTYKTSSWFCCSMMVLTGFFCLQIEYGETDAWLSMELMFHLSVLPLTRQLTNISGNLWGRTLQVSLSIKHDCLWISLAQYKLSKYGFFGSSQGARAQRVEYLLLHAFHAKKYIVPDKFSSHSKEAKMTKRRMNNGSEDKNVDELDIDEANIESDFANYDHGKGKKGPAYSGGLVLEPKRGLYDKYVLLLDFNSLYPSIIQVNITNSPLYLYLRHSSPSCLTIVFLWNEAVLLSLDS